MTIHHTTRVGKKGEILPKKDLREVSGIKPGDEVLIEAHEGQILIKKIYSVDELLKMSVIAEGTAEEIEEEIEEEAKNQQELSE